MIPNEWWTTLVGKTCTCPPDCTDTIWGNGPRDCDPKCEPCNIMRGRPYKRPGTKGTKP